VIFVDTSLLFALFDRDDERHARARAALDQFRGQRLGECWLTTNHVVGETITLLVNRGHRDPRQRHALAVRVGEELFAGRLGRLHQVGADEERAGFDYLRRHADQRYSFVDCVSFVVMQQQGIAEALTFDDDFAHRFVVRPGRV
jgi:predicted nucleic acid-binding protein